VRDDRQQAQDRDVDAAWTKPACADGIAVMRAVRKALDAVGKKGISRADTLTVRARQAPEMIVQRRIPDAREVDDNSMDRQSDACTVSYSVTTFMRSKVCHRSSLPMYSIQRRLFFAAGSPNAVERQTGRRQPYDCCDGGRICHGARRSKMDPRGIRPRHILGCQFARERILYVFCKNALVCFKGLAELLIGSV
jgi:hypothetical protein